jgi:alkylhydroperoxidase/carboxymuconolactone decarboxylase family protein YurZ
MSDARASGFLDRRELVAKYGKELLDRPALLRPERFEEKLAQRDALDQHFAKISMEFVSRVCHRGVLDQRSRFLVQVGQFAVSKSYTHLEDAIRGAIGAGVSTREILESILMTHIYSGDTVLEPALTLYTRILRETGLLASMRDGQLPLDGHDDDRDLAAERKLWPEDVADDPRRERLVEKFGWRAVSTGMRYRGTTHLNIVEGFDREDPDFGRLWLTFTYQGMYSRWVLDDKTRLLCTTGDCLALGAAAAASAKDHMQEALHFGNSPDEIFDMIYMSGVFFGFPGMTAARMTLLAILKEEGRLEELRGARPAPQRQPTG